MIDEKLGERVLAFLDLPGWTFNSDKSGIKLKTGENTISLSFDCAQCICWNDRVIYASDYPEGESYFFGLFRRGEVGILKEIRVKGRAIFAKLRKERLEEAKKNKVEYIQNVLEEMG
jgi:hypothetical protein